MNLRLRRDELLTNLKKCQTIIKTKNILPVLSNVLLEKKGDKLKIEANNLEIVRVIMLGDIYAEGEDVSFCLPHSLLVSILASSTSSDVVFELKDHERKCQIKLEDAQFNIPYLLEEEFPKFDSMMSETLETDCHIKAEVLYELFRKTIYAASTDDDNRIKLNCVNLSYDKVMKEIRTVATDGQRLAKSKILNFSLENIENFATKISLSSFPHVLSFLKDCEQGANVRFKLNSKIGILDYKGNYVCFRLLENDALDVDKYFSEYEKDYTALEFNKDQLSMFLTRAEILYGKTSHIVFHFDDDCLSVSVKNQDLGQLVDKIPILTKNNHKLMICFNPKYLIESLNNLGGERVKIYYKENTLPIIMEAEKEGVSKDIGVVMPLRFLDN